MSTVTRQLIIVLIVHHYMLAFVNKHISLIGYITLSVCGFVAAALHHKCLSYLLSSWRGQNWRTWIESWRELRLTTRTSWRWRTCKWVHVETFPQIYAPSRNVFDLFSFSMNFWLTNWPRNFTSWATHVTFKTASSRLPRWRVVIETCKLHALMTTDMRVVSSPTQDAMEALQKEVGDRGIQ